MDLTGILHFPSNDLELNQATFVKLMTHSQVISCLFMSKEYNVSVKERYGPDMIAQTDGQTDAGKGNF